MNIPTPQLPTDNLYKFLAISCIAVFIFSLWLVQTKTREVSALNFRTTRTHAHTITQVNQLHLNVTPIDEYLRQWNIATLTAPSLKTSDKGERDRILAQFDDIEFSLIAYSKPLSLKATLDAINAPGYAEQVKAALNWTDEQIAEQVARMKTKEGMAEAMIASEKNALVAQALLPKWEQLRTDVAELWELVDDTRWIQIIFGWILAPLSIFFAVQGFFLWYRRVQKYQDKLLINSVLASETEPSPKPLSPKAP